MGKAVLKNWSSRDVIRFLKKNGFLEIKKKKRSKGDHCCLLNPETGHYTEVDKRNSFSRREMSAFVEQTGISEDIWLKKRKKK